MSTIHNLHQDHSRELARNPARTALAWGLVAAFLVLGLLLVQHYRNQRAKQSQTSNVTQEKSVVTVSTARAAFRSVDDDVISTGSISAVDPLQVGAEISGLRVTSVQAEQGDFVHKGQVLATLNASVLQAQLTQAEARRQAAVQQVPKAQQPNRPQDIAGLQAALSQSEASISQNEAALKQSRVTLKNAELTAQRYKSVYSQGFVTAQEASDKQAEADRLRLVVTAAEQQVEAARFQRDQARQRLGLAQVGGRSEDVAIAQAGAAEASGATEQLQAQIDQTVVRAPDDGLVVRRDIHIGEISSNSKAFFVIARRGELELRAEVPQDQLVSLRKGLRADITFGRIKAKGHIWQVEPEVNATTRLGVARILLEGHTPLRLGMFAQARIGVGEHRALTVPFSAVLGEGGAYYVFRLTQDSHAERVAVSTGSRTNQAVEVVDGLHEGDTVVVDGARFLSNGDKVDVGTPAPALKAQQ